MVFDFQFYKNAQSVLLVVEVLVMFGESLRHEQREDEGGVAVHLDGLRGVGGEFAPGDGFVGLSAGVRSIELLAGVHVYGVVSAIAHEVGVEGVVLDDASTQHQNPRGVRINGRGVDASHILHHVHAKARRGTVGVGEQNVSQGTVGYARTEHRNVVLKQQGQRKMTLFNFQPARPREYRNNYF